jgi:hypothetical protein
MIAALSVKRHVAARLRSQSLRMRTGGNDDRFRDKVEGVAADTHAAVDTLDAFRLGGDQANTGPSRGFG